MYEDMYKQFEAYPTGIMKGWLTNKNWVISTPIETHIASEDRAIRQLKYEKSIAANMVLIYPQSKEIA